MNKLLKILLTLLCLIQCITFPTVFAETSGVEKEQITFTDTKLT